eukprot:s2512_g12.t1
MFEATSIHSPLPCRDSTWQPFASAARRPKRDEPCSGPIPAWVYEGPSPDASPSSPPVVPRPRASPSRTAASSPGGDARSRTGGRGGGGNGGIGGIAGIGENMLRGPPQTDTSSGLVELQQLLKMQELPTRTGGLELGLLRFKVEKVVNAPDQEQQLRRQEQQLQARRQEQQQQERLNEMRQNLKVLEQQEQRQRLAEQMAGSAKGDFVETGHANGHQHAQPSSHASAVYVRKGSQKIEICFPLLLRLAQQHQQQDLLSHILLLHQSAQLQQLRQVQTEQPDSSFAGYGTGRPNAPAETSPQIPVGGASGSGSGRGAAYFNILQLRLFLEAAIRVHGIRAIEACITIAGDLMVSHANSQSQQCTLRTTTTCEKLLRWSASPQWQYVVVAQEELVDEAVYLFLVHFLSFRQQAAPAFSAAFLRKILQ